MAMRGYHARVDQSGHRKTKTTGYHPLYAGVKIKKKQNLQVLSQPWQCMGKQRPLMF